MSGRARLPKVGVAKFNHRFALLGSSCLGLWEDTTAST